MAVYSHTSNAIASIILSASVIILPSFFFSNCKDNAMLSFYTPLLQLSLITFDKNFIICFDWLTKAFLVYSLDINTGIVLAPFSFV